MSEPRVTRPLGDSEAEPVAVPRPEDDVVVRIPRPEDDIVVRPTPRPEDDIVVRETPGQKAVVKAMRLTKSFPGAVALSDVSLTLYEGEIFGLVGPNGAGKTTLLRILATLSPPDSGTAEICGFTLRDVKEVRIRIGFMPDVLGVYDDMLVREYLEFFARACKIPEATRAFSIEETMATVGIQHLAQQPVDGLSRGMKQRLGLARAILHKPRVLLLDEPASGLDPLARLELREILRSMRRNGVTIVISSHVLEDLADICDRIGVVSKGKLVTVEATQKLIQVRGARRMRLRAATRAEELFQMLKAYPNVKGLRWDGDCVVFSFEGAEDVDLARLLQTVVQKSIPLVQFTEDQPNLESAYLNVTQAQS